MKDLKVSVIVPAYKGACSLPRLIKSVLDQTYPHFELLIVDDASTDNTTEIVGGFDDSRIRYLRHDTNRGVAMARRTGLEASTGDIIAYLDQDDMFHPEKLQRHVDLHAQQPDTGFSYNAYFDLECSSTDVANIVRPKVEIGLADLVLGFPIPPSSWVIRRDWAFSDEIWDPQTLLRGAEIVHLGRLFLSGCKFRGVNRALQYRAHHSGRTYSELLVKCEEEITCQKLVFADPRCPAALRSLQNQAHANIYLIWSSWAYMQGETAVGKELLWRTVALAPGIVDGAPCKLMRFWVDYATADFRADHEEVLDEMLRGLPAKLGRLGGQRRWAVAQGYLAKGTRAMIWGRESDGDAFLAKARDVGAEIDDWYIRMLTDRLVNYEMEFGPGSARGILRDLYARIEQLGGRNGIRRLQGNLHINQAFRDYRAGDFSAVPGNVISAIRCDPSYLANRGVLSMLLRSGLTRIKGPTEDR